ncbi:metallophosphoesterase family protein [Salipaludibacillus daqingensis]|uniref:metallophosphoesterase family protein n=1 Tax=Salipaludibacillus daqingensis TaxID=3041001 RepID=UPI0024731540|nr:metallophosphoesterase family protein [Salipaludibacillus daqingensis]
MKVMVISDTHIPKRAKKLPDRIISDLKKADLIIHAGDWQTLEVYKDLSQYGEVKGVYGNVDNDEIKAHFPKKLILELNGHKIGVVHGHGRKLTTERRAQEAFKDDHVDCIIFGHSHIPVQKLSNDILLFNPGSATDKRRQSNYSYGILMIKNEIKKQSMFIFQIKHRKNHA